jgi:hypothetical protein
MPRFTILELFGERGGAVLTRRRPPRDLPGAKLADEPDRRAAVSPPSAAAPHSQNHTLKLKLLD